MFEIHPVRLDEARTVTSWEYPAPYDVYNPDPRDVDMLIEPGNSYYSVVRDGELVGFFCTGEEARVPGGAYDEAATDLGLGMRPDLTGQGFGLVFLRTILDGVYALNGGIPIRLTVAAFNDRARRLYESSGFVVSHKFVSRGGREYFQMVQSPDAA